MIPKPTSQKTGVPIQKSIRFFIMMLPAFFALVNPVSTIANPACMKKTSAAPKRTQIVFTEEYIVTLPFPIFFFLLYMGYIQEGFFQYRIMKIDRIYPVSV